MNFEVWVSSLDQPSLWTIGRGVCAVLWDMYEVCLYHMTCTGEGKILSGKINLSKKKILPGKNSVPKFKNGGQNSVPSGFGKG